MNFDLLKYILSLIDIPLLMLAGVFIFNGTDDTISTINCVGFILLIISGISIINRNKDKDNK